MSWVLVGRPYGPSRRIGANWRACSSPIASAQCASAGGLQAAFNSLRYVCIRFPFRSCYYHDSAVALIENGEVIYAAQEERFTRKKHDESFPEKAILNSQLHQQVIIESQAEFTASQVRQLKDFYKDFFDDQPQASEAKVLAQDTINRFKTLNDDVMKLLYQKEQYPFLSALTPVAEKLDSMSKKQYGFFSKR